MGSGAESVERLARVLYNHFDRIRDSRHAMLFNTLVTSWDAIQAEMSKPPQGQMELRLEHLNRETNPKLRRLLRLYRDSAQFSTAITGDQDEILSLENAIIRAWKPVTNRRGVTAK